jgi:pilus assembly protein FimV
LLEIYTARRSTAAFEAVAGELYAALGNKSSPLWDKACEMGRSIDPTNPLYGGVQSSATATVAATAAVAGGAVVFDAPAAAPAEPEPVTASAPMEFESAGHILNFDAPAAAPVATATADTGFAEADTHSLDFDLGDLDVPATTDDMLKLDLGLEEDNGPDSKFDFSGLDLDLGDSGGNDLELDEVGTKLDLARAYVEMGDKDGAREILNEVLAEGNDKQKADAKGLMASLG